MSKETFQSFIQQGYNRVPVVKQVIADLDTPVSTFLKLGNSAYTYLFESVQGGEKWGRYSIIGLPCRKVFRIYGYRIEIEVDGNVVETFEVDDPLDYVEQLQQQFNAPRIESLPRFTGGLVGYFGYDTIRYVEKKLAHSQPKDELGVPDILLMVSDEVVVFDNLTGTLYIIVYVDVESDPAPFDSAMHRVDAIHQQLRQPRPKIDRNDVHTAISESDFKSGFTQAKFEQAVEKIKEYVLAGDVMQVVPSQRMTIPYDEEPFDLYRALRCLNPSPYMYCLNLSDFHIVGSSPEILVREEGGMVTVRPIAGTRKRGKSEEEDQALEQELLNDPKEIAEHLMLIDLGRNDIGRIAKVGSVEVTEEMIIERYSHVMHIVSNVQGEIKDNMSAIDVLRATFPAGTLSGAPKIRAMEIIDELEPVKRCVYGGAVGYLSWQGDMDTAIAIRTAVIKDKKLYVQAGAGVVADSVPRLEWKETMNKGRALFRAVEMVKAGLDPEKVTR